MLVNEEIVEFEVHHDEVWLSLAQGDLLWLLEEDLDIECHQCQPSQFILEQFDFIIAILVEGRIDVDLQHVRQGIILIPLWCITDATIIHLELSVAVVLFKDIDWWQNDWFAEDDCQVARLRDVVNLCPEWLNDLS